MTKQLFPIGIGSFGGSVSIVRQVDMAGIRRTGTTSCVWAAPQLTPLISALERGETSYEGGILEAVFLQYVNFYLFGIGRLGKVIDFQKVLMPLPHKIRPDFVSFILTKFCNFRCLHCYNASGRPDSNELSSSEKISTVDFLGRWGVPFLILSGGEPTLDPSFAGILKKAEFYGMRVKLTTNGWQIPRSLLDAIKAGVVTQINFSLDGPDAESHDYYRGRAGSFDRLASGILQVKEAGLRNVVINSCIGAGRVGYMESLVRVAIKYGCGELSFKALLFAGRDASEGRARILSNTEIRLFHAERDRLHFAFRDEISIEGNLITNDVSTELRNDISCNAASLAMTIGADGSLYPCEIISPYLEAPNVRDISPAQAWNEDEVFQRFREVKVTKPGGCGTSGCPGSAFAGDKLTTIAV
jgi:MoaA/NifB/PqqE/SkfB family radical SAM enzyme